MRILTKKEFYEISGGKTIMNTIGNVIVLEIQAGSTFELDGYSFSTSDTMTQGGIYNGYRVEFSPTGPSARGKYDSTIFVLTPVA